MDSSGSLPTVGENMTGALASLHNSNESVFTVSRVSYDMLRCVGFFIPSSSYHTQGTRERERQNGTSSYHQPLPDLWLYMEASSERMGFMENYPLLHMPTPH